MAAGRSVTILYFAVARTLLGISSETMGLPAGSDSLPLCSLPDLLSDRHPQHADELRKVIRGSRWSVDQTLIDADEVEGVELKGGEEIAVIPPGGERAGQSEVAIEPIPKELKVKPAPSAAGLRAFASSHTSPADGAPLLSSTLSYSPAPSGTESNLLVLFHGLGDTARPFATLGQSLQRTLPQTAILSVQASKRVPFLDEGEEAWMWWDTFDAFGEILTKPNPTATVSGIRTLFDYLTSSKDDDGCGWPPFALHLFGFGQGGSVALESAVAFVKARRSRGAAGASASTNPKLSELGSVVSVCAGLISHPTLDPLPGLPVLYLYRTPTGPTSTLASLRKATRALNVERLEAIELPDGEVVTEAMPRNQKEWDPIMQFWSRLLRNRIKWEVDGELYTAATEA